MARVLANALLLGLFISTISCINAACAPTFNDVAYPGLDPNKCVNPANVPCTPQCTVGVGTQGHYIVPLNGDCTSLVKSTTKVYCAANAALSWQCCNFCFNKSKCAYWQHYVPPGITCTGCGICYVYPAAAGPPTCATTTVVCNSITRLRANASTLGQPCSTIKNDPHFRGADGARFEFNGLPDQTFCLLTDRNLHVNMRMRGYYDTRTVGASVLKNGKAVRTWIRELGILWTDASTGVKHTFRLVARDGKSMARGDGYLKTIEYDGKALSLLQVGEKYSLDGGLVFSFEAHEKAGGGFFDVDAYKLTIDGLVEMLVKLRPAHPLLQTPDDAETHINVHMSRVTKTADVHGIMGQTYREGRKQRALDYATLSELTGRPFAADGEDGKGYLDGTVADYRTSGVLSSDCVYSAYDGHNLPVIAAYKGLSL